MMEGPAVTRRGTTRATNWVILALVALFTTQGHSAETPEYCMIGCSAHRLIGFILYLDQPNTVYWWPGPSNTRVWLEGPGILKWVNLEEDQRRKWHKIYTFVNAEGNYCLESESLGVPRVCGYQEYLHITAETSSLWSLGCQGVPCGCPDVTSSTCEDHLPVISGCCLYKLQGVKVPLEPGVTRVFWWARTVHSGVMVRGPGVVELVDVDKVHEGLWHLVTVDTPQPDEKTTTALAPGETKPPPSSPTCRVTSDSLSLSWNCTQDVTPTSSLDFRAFDSVDNSFAPGHWALGCQYAPEDVGGEEHVVCEDAGRVVAGTVPPPRYLPENGAVTPSGVAGVAGVVVAAALLLLAP